MSMLRGSRSSFGSLSAKMPIATAHTVEYHRFTTAAGWFRFRPEIELNCLPSIATLRLQAKTGGWLVTAVDHTILAAAVPRDAVHHPVSVPLGFVEQLRIARVMAVGHQIAGPLPSANVSS